MRRRERFRLLTRGNPPDPQGSASVRCTAVGAPGRDLFAEVALLQPPPPPSASACLDAAARCIVRDGLAHTSVPDVARELGVSRGTVYRQVGPMPVIVRQLLRREGGRVLLPAPGPPLELDPPRPGPLNGRR